MRPVTESRPRLRRQAFGALLAIAACATASSDARAQSQVRVIPYEGYLRVAPELGGELGDISIPMRFTLYGSDGTAVWSEEYSGTPETNSCDLDDCSVAVIDGRFSVGLGQYDGGIIDLDWSQAYYLGIELYADGAWFDLDNRERLAPVPWAFLAEQATNYAVDGEVAVDGDLLCRDTAVSAHSLVVTGAATVESHINVSTTSVTTSADVDGTVRLSGGITTAALLLQDGAPISLAPGDEVIVGDGTSLVFDRNGSLANGFDIGGNLTVASATLNGGLDATSTNTNGTLTMEDWSVVGSRDLIRVVWVSMSGFAYGDTGVDYDQYWCIVAGMWIKDGRFSGSSSSALFFYNTYERDDGNWGVESNVPHNDSDAETHNVGVICVQRQAAVVPSDWFVRFETFP